MVACSLSEENTMGWFRRGLLLVLPAAFLMGAPAVPVFSQGFGPQFYQEMRWRLIGPFRGGRVLAVAGVASEPDVYYFGSVDGGVWKSTDDGRVWRPVFDREPIASIGALAVAPSNPRILYAGTGEADMRSDISFGDGVYRSADGGKTWRNVGLRDTRQIGKILIDPRNPDVVFVAALGHAYGPNSERGVFRSTDGGKTWQKVLYQDENTGAIDLAFEPANPRVVYAALWQARRPAWSTYAPLEGPGGGLYKSTDGGTTWRRLAGHGLPRGPLGRMGVAVGYGKQGNRVYALVKAKQGGLYRSDDGGESWRRVNASAKLWTRGWYFGGVTVDPGNAEIVYVANVVLYRSRDGGRHFAPLKGAPGGDDYHTVWVNPRHPQRMIVGSDQGTIVSVNGGATWSSWYNQPTAQFYHVATDHRIPYHVYGAQQDSGSADVPSRSDYGEITFRDWHPVGAGESGYLLPDPADPEIVYGGSTYGGLHRYDHRTTQSQDVSPYFQTHFGADISKARYRFTWTSPLAFSPQDPHVLYMGSQYLLETTDGGRTWRAISPDLTVRPGTEEEKQRGVIYAIAPSALRAGEIWAGTDNGLVELTLDGGKSWRNVTPAALAAWSKVSTIEASPYDPAGAYLAVDRHRLDDYAPYIYRTHDYGRSWRKITAGIPSTAFVRVVRADPVRKGLLFAGTETGVYVSFDDGDHWQSLQLNLPAASVRDLAIEQGDLIAATHGRAFWILDDLSPLRQLSPAVAASAPAYLFRPRAAWRIRRSTNTDTPLPPETPAGQNPPDGAILDYYLPTAAAGPVTLEILDHRGRLVRRFSSAHSPAPATHDGIELPGYWARPPESLATTRGIHRFVWHLHATPPQSTVHALPMTAIPHDTPLSPLGPAVLPGSYTVQLTVAGRRSTRPLEVRMDPRVKTSPEDLAEQFRFASRIGEAMDRNEQAAREVGQVRERVEQLEKQAGRRPIGQALAAFDKKLAGPAGPGGNSFNRLGASLLWLYETVNDADTAPTAAEEASFTELDQSLAAQLAEWQSRRETDLPALNQELRRAGLPTLAPL
jgi:photosystem II stability/assembly factor-like uncharacterized protein